MIFKTKYISRYCVKRFSNIPCNVGKFPRFIPNHKHTWQSTASLRARFIDYFIKHDHKYIEPCSLNSKNVGSYFVNSGVSQFKEHILGHSSSFLDVRKAVNSQRCVRLGGKKCDLTNIGYDSTHLSYFEMLGNWSFGSYNKNEACKLMWRFLTEELELPSSHLYVTYFGGSEKLGLPSDDETRDIWFSLGIKDSKILQFGEEHNFWEMGDRSLNPLCGPSTEIHWDYLATLGESNEPRCARCFVNSSSPEVAELWNCVFMEYKWMDGGKTLSKLPALIIDTGMGLERLASIIQGVSGVFDTDGFKDILNHLSDISKSPRFEGTLSMDMESPVSQRLQSAAKEYKVVDNQLRRDTSYRVIADHLRAICLCVNDGILPGRQGLELKVRHLLQRSIRQSRFGLGMTGGLSQVVDTVCDTMQEWHDIKPAVRNKLKIIIDKEEINFFPKLDMYEKSFDNFLHQRDSKNEQLSDEDVLTLMNGKFGQSISLDMIRAMCRDFGLLVNENIECEETNVLGDFKSDAAQYLSGSNMLLDRNIPVTDYSPIYNYVFNDVLNVYEVADLQTSVAAIILVSKLDNIPSLDSASTQAHISDFGLLTTETNMFATKGGQECDEGVILSGQDGVVMATINSVVVLDTGHIIHWCTLANDTTLIRVADQILLRVNSDKRTGTTLHHTGHHIVFGVLNKLLGRINQASSSVKFDHGRLGFSLHVSDGNVKSLQSDDLVTKIEAICSDIIKKEIPIVKKENVNFSQISKDSSIRYLKSESLPNKVRLVSIGDFTEVCCGTHAENTGHLQDIVITSLKRTNQAISEISFVVGQRALKMRQQDEKFIKIVNEIDNLTNDKRHQIDDLVNELKHSLSGQIMSTRTRFRIKQAINAALKFKIEAPSISEILKERFSSLLLAPDDICTLKIDLTSVKKATKTLAVLKISNPTILYDLQKILIFFPKRNIDHNVREFLSEYCKESNHSMSDIIIESPSTKGLDTQILSQFVIISLPDNFNDSDKLVIHLNNHLRHLLY